MTLSNEVRKLEEDCLSLERQIVKLTQEVEYFINAYDSEDYTNRLPADRTCHTRGLRAALEYVYACMEGDQ